MFEPHFTGPDRTIFADELKKNFISQGPQDWYGALVALLNPLVWQGLSKVGKALVDLIKLDQHVKRVCKVREQPREDEKKVKQTKRLV